MPLVMQKTQMLLSLRYTSVVSLFGLLFAPNSCRHYLVNFRPPQYAQSVGYDRRVVLTGSGRFVIPEGVTHIRAVLIEAGEGGWSGLPGEEAAEQKTVNSSGGTHIAQLTKYYTTAGKGGKAGLGGQGGKIYQFEMDVEAGQEFAYSCGPGGPGGA